MLLYYLAQEKVVSLSDPVTKFMPNFAVVNPYDMSKSGVNAVTLESLASHTSGLTRDIECNAKEECTEQMCIDQINQVPLFHQPLARSHYSNVGFALLGRCLEHAAQDYYQDKTLTYESLVKKSILDLFGMNSSGFNYTDDIKERMAIGCLFPFCLSSCFLMFLVRFWFVFYVFV